MRYWIYWNDLVQGPFELEELVGLKAFAPELPVCREDAQEWHRAEFVSEFYVHFVTLTKAKSTQPGLPPHPPTHPPRLFATQGELFTDQSAQPRLLDAGIASSYTYPRESSLVEEAAPGYYTFPFRVGGLQVAPPTMISQLPKTEYSASPSAEAVQLNIVMPAQEPAAPSLFPADLPQVAKTRTTLTSQTSALPVTEEPAPVEQPSISLEEACTEEALLSDSLESPSVSEPEPTAPPVPETKSRYPWIEAARRRKEELQRQADEAKLNPLTSTVAASVDAPPVRESVLPSYIDTDRDYSQGSAKRARLWPWIGAVTLMVGIGVAALIAWFNQAPAWSPVVSPAATQPKSMVSQPSAVTDPIELPDEMPVPKKTISHTPPPLHPIVAKPIVAKPTKATPPTDAFALPKEKAARAMPKQIQNSELASFPTVSEPLMSEAPPIPAPARRAPTEDLKPATLPVRNTIPLRDTPSPAPVAAKAKEPPVAVALPGIVVAPTPPVWPAIEMKVPTPAPAAMISEARAVIDPFHGREKEAIDLVMKEKIYGGKKTVGSHSKNLLDQMHEKELLHAAETGERLYLPDKLAWAALQEEGPFYHVYLNFSALEANGERLQTQSHHFRVSLKDHLMTAEDAATKAAYYDTAIIPDYKANPMTKDIESILSAVDLLNKQLLRAEIVKGRKNKNEQKNIQVLLQAGNAKLQRAVVYFRTRYAEKPLQNIAKAFNFQKHIQGK